MVSVRFGFSLEGMTRESIHFQAYMVGVSIQVLKVCWIEGYSFFPAMKLEADLSCLPYGPPQHVYLLPQSPQGKESLSKAVVMVLDNVITKGTFQNFCHILVVRNNLQVPHILRENDIRAWIQNGGEYWRCFQSLFVATTVILVLFIFW